MNPTKPLLLILTLLLIFSCKEEYTLEEKKEALTLERVEIENGILAFSSKDFLNKTISDLKNSNLEELETELNVYYEKGFRPLYPHYNDGDYERISDFTQRKISISQKILEKNPQLKTTQATNGIVTLSDDMNTDLDDEIISDDEFASVLNNKREIIVNDTLYRFTYSGMFAVHKNQKKLLDDYIAKKDIEYLVPDPNALVRGDSQISDKISLSLPEIDDIYYPEKCRESEMPRFEEFFNNPCRRQGGDGSSGSGSKPKRKPTPIDHTQSLVNLMTGLNPCKTLKGFLNSGAGLFGVSRKCYSNFDSKHRTKTKYWKENYLIYHSIGVKVKHQKRGWTRLWRAKSTDEVALSISQATFEFNIDLSGFPKTYAPEKLYFFENKIFNSQAKLINYSNAIYKPPFPKVPFVSEVVVTYYLANDFVDVDVEMVRKLFYSGVWNGAKSIVQSYKNRNPRNITQIIYTPTKVYFNYVDINNRQKNVKKIVNRLDYNFGLGFKFNVDVDSRGHYSTDITSVGDAIGNIVIPKLYDYENAKMDFIGASRKGDTWKGSRIIYTD